MRDYEISLTIENRRDVRIDFILEPWGEIHTMEPGVTFTLSFRSPTQGIAHIDDEADRMTVWAWSGCTASLTHNGEELDDEPFSRTPVP